MRHLSLPLAALVVLAAVVVPASASAAEEAGEPPPPAPTAPVEPSSDDAELPTEVPEPPPADEPATPDEPATSEPPTTEPVDPEPSAPLPSPDPPAEEPAEEPAPDDGLAATESDTVQGADVRAAQQQEKVTICHRTNSRTNPYNQIVVTKAAAIDGHASHRGPIFAPGVDDWGDIIAPIRPGLPRGRNWPEGRAILDNGCEVQPDVGPVPDAGLGQVVCTAGDASLAVTVTNGAQATAPASFSIVVDGTVVETVGPVAPGDSETVTLGGDIDSLEDQTFTIEVRSDGQVLTSEVVTVDCEPGPPSVAISAQLECAGTTATGTVVATDNAAGPVSVSLAVDGVPAGAPVVVAPGATESGSVDLAQYEDQTITVSVLADGAVVATYVVTPDCVAPQADPGIHVGAVECPPPTTTVTLANTGDPDSRVVFVIRINGEVVQVSAPLYGGDTTTIVGDLSRYEGQTVTVELRANGEVLGSRTITVNCRRPGPNVGPGGGGGIQPAAAVSGPSTAARTDTLPAVGAEFDLALVAAALGLVGLGCVLLIAGRRNGRPGTGLS